MIARRREEEGNRIACIAPPDFFSRSRRRAGQIASHILKACLQSLHSARANDPIVLVAV
jgi:hypothetical protein